MFSKKIFSHFIWSHTKPDSQGARYSHEINKVKKNPRQRPAELRNAEKYTASWYAKESIDKQSAQEELIAQEFFRLLLPLQPKTRQIDGLEKYIVSKEVPGYRVIYFEDAQSVDGVNAEFVSGVSSDTYRRFGAICLIAFFLNEVDLKPGNFGLNEDDYFIKIDGDWSFAYLKARDEKDRYAITPTRIANLPNLDLADKNHIWVLTKYTHANNEKLNSLAKNHYVRRDINEAILKILLLPDSYIAAFIDCYLSPQDSKNILALLLERKRDLRAAALANTSFNEYLNSAIAANTTHDYLIYLQHFKITGHNQISYPNLAKEIENNLNVLRNPERELTISHISYQTYLAIVQRYIYARTTMDNGRVQLDWLSRNILNSQLTAEKLCLSHQMIDFLNTHPSYDELILKLRGYKLEEENLERKYSKNYSPTKTRKCLTMLNDLENQIIQDREQANANHHVEMRPLVGK